MSYTKSLATVYRKIMRQTPCFNPGRDRYVTVTLSEEQAMHVARLIRDSAEWYAMRQRGLVNY